MKKDNQSLRRSPARRCACALLIGVVCLAALCLGAVGGLYVYIARDLPDIRPLRKVDGIRAVMAPVLDGGYVFAQEVYRPVEFAELPPHLVNAFVASMDRQFFTGTRWALFHEGCNPFVRRMLVYRLLWDSEREQRSRLHKNVLSLQISLLLSREQEFAVWLNSLYFGNHAYGIEAAGLIYFGRPAAELSLAEAALLAALPMGPAYYDPARDPEAIRDRRNWLLSVMRDMGFITQEESLFASLMPIYPPVSSAYLRALSRK